MSQRPTIITVAKACGVTDGTVSRALRNDPRVSAATRAKVQEAARALGYQPHGLARGLKQGKSGLIGVLLDSEAWMLYNDYFGRLLAGLLQAAEGDGRHPIFYLPRFKARHAPFPQHSDVRMGGLDDLADGRVDAVVLVGGRLLGGEDLRVLRSSGVPMVWISPNEPTPGFRQLASGSATRSEAVGRLLAGHGHKRVGFLGLFQGSSFNTSALRGLKRGLGPRKTVACESLQQWDICDPAHLALHLDKLLKVGITALVVSNADQSMVVLDLLAQRGVRVPEDLSVVTFGPASLGMRARTPLLSLFDCDLVEGGMQAYELLKSVEAGKVSHDAELKWALAPGGQTIRSL